MRRKTISTDPWDEETNYKDEINYDKYYSKPNDNDYIEEYEENEEQ